MQRGPEFTANSMGSFLNTMQHEMHPIFNNVDVANLRVQALLEGKVDRDEHVPIQVMEELDRHIIIRYLFVFLQPSALLQENIKRQNNLTHQAIEAA